MNGTFKLPSREAEYYVGLSVESGAAPLPPVFTSIHNNSSQKFLDDLVHYRKDEKYYASLAEEGRTKNLPPVITRIREESSSRFLHNLQNYRQDVYKIIDDQTYEIISNGKSEILC
ncbi:hypothetical protein MSG28_004363 [Choristoneura fumiferana]|uniref:Uncharacterized protein n=1 Tax=Choristoneura fumiferana TaxID=7141 RepID=A0ACC0KJD4_CHOFU|nr:hypothetical protein MSG28_004363 [Choristoneura fumiferana]